MDWKVVAAAPLVLENQLPVSGTYMIWETPRVCHPVHPKILQTLKPECLSTMHSCDAQLCTLL